MLFSQAEPAGFTSSQLEAAVKERGHDDVIGYLDAAIHRVNSEEVDRLVAKDRS
jgi:hypothetical protein